MGDLGERNAAVEGLSCGLWALVLVCNLFPEPLSPFLENEMILYLKLELIFLRIE